MGWFMYHLEIKGADIQGISKIYQEFKDKNLISGVFAFESFEPRKGGNSFSLKLESLFMEKLDTEEYEKFFCNLSKEYPKLVFEFEGLGEENSFNTIFKKAFKNGLFKEVSFNSFELDFLLEQREWSCRDAYDHDPGLRAVHNKLSDKLAYAENKARDAVNAKDKEANRYKRDGQQR